MTGPPAADIEITLSPEDLPREREVRAAAECALGDLVEGLALPLAARTVTVGPGDRTALSINGVPCALPPSRYLLRLRSDVEHCVAQAIDLRADLLLTPEVTGALWRRSADPPEVAGPAPTWFSDVAGELVRHRVAPARLRAVSGAGEEDPRILVEQALADSARPIRILLDERTWATWTEGPQEAPGLMSVLASGLEDELGLPVAVPELDVDPSLPEHHVVVVLGDVRSRPLPGLRPDQLLVNDTRARLELLQLPGLAPEEVVNPATGQPGAVVSADASDVLEGFGLTVWTMSGCVVLTAAEFVRRHAHCLLRAELLQYQLDRSAAGSRLLLPMVQALGGVERLARVLRRLLREQVPIQDLPTIVAALHAAVELSPPDPSCVRAVTTRRHRPPVVPATEVGDADEAALAETARRAASTRIVHKHTGGTTTLVVYLLPPTVEDRLRDPRQLSRDERREILDMIDAEVAFLPPTARVPALLTREPVRWRLRSLIQVEQPKMPVLAYEQLPGDLNIQPVARLSL